MRIIKYELDQKFDWTGDELFDTQVAYKIIMEKVKHIENAYL